MMRELTVTVGGTERVVEFEYEGDGVFCWAFPGDTETNGQGLTEADRQGVDDQLWAWYVDWAAPRSEDDAANS